MQYLFLSCSINIAAMTSFQYLGTRSHQCQIFYALDQIITRFVIIEVLLKLLIASTQWFFTYYTTMSFKMFNVCKSTDYLKVRKLNSNEYWHIYTTNELPTGKLFSFYHGMSEWDSTGGWYGKRNVFIGNDCNEVHWFREPK